MQLCPATRLAIAVAGTGVTSVLTLAGLGRTATSPADAQEAVPQNDFAITGEIDGLYPGQHTTLDAQITNPQSFTIKVTSIEVTADDAGPDCAASWLHFDPITDPVDVAAGATATVPVPVEFDFAAPETCRDATWPLTYYATAVAPDTEIPPTTTPPTPTTTPGPVDEGHVPERLARTGIDLAPFVAVGTLLMAAGLLARRVARRSVL